MHRLLPLLAALGCADPGPSGPVDSDADDVRADSDLDSDADTDVAVERPQVVVNELMASNQSSLVVDGATPDWIELHNLSDAEVSLAGWTLEDGGSGPIALGAVTVPARGFLVLYADDGGVAPVDTEPGPHDEGEDGEEDESEHEDDEGSGPPTEERWRHLPFRLSREADRVTITDLAGRADTLGFEVLQAEDFSLARVPDGCADPACLRRVHLGTPGASNGVAP